MVKWCKYLTIYITKVKSFNKRVLSLPGIWGTVPSGLDVGVDLIDDFFPLSSGFFLPLDELSDPGLRGDFLPSTPFSRGEWWFPLAGPAPPAPDSLASSTTRSWSSFSPSEVSASLLSFLCSGEPGRSLRCCSLSRVACCSPGLRELLWNEIKVEIWSDRETRGVHFDWEFNND